MIYTVDFMIKIGILCPSEIAFRRFLPALMQCPSFQYIGVAFANKLEWCGDKNQSTDEDFEQIRIAEKNKALQFQKTYGGKIFDSYDKLLNSGEVDAIYIPLPPSLHYKWTLQALCKGINCFVEKPFTTSIDETKALVNIASKKNLVIHENYMFIYHSQLEVIKNVIDKGEIGDVRLCRIDFGFPERGKNDFRYKKTLGGGALMDCGGYTLKLACFILGKDAKLVSANSIYSNKFDVDIGGVATLRNAKGYTVQVAFGMDNDYRCSIDVWGSKGSLKSERILTAPAGFIPSFFISKNGQVEQFEMKADDSFFKSINHFEKCLFNNMNRENNYKDILNQAILVDDFINLASK